jgi:hypothetical protein
MSIKSSDYFEGLEKFEKEMELEFKMVEHLSTVLAAIEKPETKKEDLCGNSSEETCH